MAIPDASSSTAPPPSTTPPAPPTNPGFYSRTLLNSGHVIKALPLKLNTGSSSVLLCRETSFSLQRLSTSTLTLSEVSDQHAFAHLLDVAAIRAPSGADTIVALAEKCQVTFLVYDNEKRILVPDGHVSLAGISAPVQSPRSLEVHPNKSLVAAAPLQGSVYVFPVLFLPSETSAGRIMSWRFQGTLLGLAWIEDDGQLSGASLLALLLQRGSHQFIQLLSVDGDSVRPVSVVSTCAVILGEAAIRRAAAKLLNDPLTQPSKATKISNIPGVPYGIVIYLIGRVVVANLRSVLRGSSPVDTLRLQNQLKCENLELSDEQPGVQIEESDSDSETVTVVTPPFIGFDLEPPAIVTTVASCGYHLGSIRGIYVASFHGDLLVLQYSTRICGLEVQPSQKGPRTQYRLEPVGYVGHIVAMAALDHNLLLTCCDAADGGLWRITPLAVGRRNIAMSSHRMNEYRVELRQEFLNLSPITDIAVKNHRAITATESDMSISEEISPQRHRRKRSTSEDQIIICCGMGRHGMLRVISKGAAVSCYSTSPAVFRQCGQLWSIRPTRWSRYDLFVVLTFAASTGVLFPAPPKVELEPSVAEGASGGIKARLLDSSEASGFILDRATLAVGLLSDGFIAQIYDGGVRVIELRKTTNIEAPIKDDGERVTESMVHNLWDWSAPDGAQISVGFVGPEIVAFSMALKGYSAKVVVLTFERNTERANPFHISELETDEQISCLSLVHLQDHRFLVLGTYKPSIDIVQVSSIFDSRSLALRRTGSFSFENRFGNAVAGSLIFMNDGAVPWLIVGMRDGLILHYAIQVANNVSDGIRLELLSSRQIGKMPVHLTKVAVTASSGVLALAERMWLGKAVNKCIEWIPLDFSGARTASALSLPGAEKCIALIDVDGSLRICGVRRVTPVSILSIPVKGTPHRVMSLKLRSLNLQCIVVAITVDDNVSALPKKVKSELRIFDCDSARLLARLRLKEGETVHVLQRYKDYIIVGTAYEIRNFHATGTPCDHGRLLLFSLICPGHAEHSQGVDELRLEFYPCSEIIFSGAVLAAASYGEEGNLIVSANEKIMMFKLLQRDYTLVEVARAATRMLVVAISCKGSLICVADRKDSLGFYKFNEETNTLERNHGDFRKRAASDCLAINENMALAPDKFGNLFSLSYDESDEPGVGSIEETGACQRLRRRLVSNHTYGLGEVAMRLSRGFLKRHDYIPDTVSPASESQKGMLDFLEEEIVVGTLNGSIITLVPILPVDLAMLSAIEKTMSRMIETQPAILGSSHGEFRSAYGSAAKGIIDGDFIGKFNLLDEQLRREIASSAGYPGKDNLRLICSLIQRLEDRVF